MGGKKILVQLARGTDQLGPFPGRRDGSISVGSQWSGLAVYVDDIKLLGKMLLPAQLFGDLKINGSVHLRSG